MNRMHAYYATVSPFRHKKRAGDAHTHSGSSETTHPARQLGAAAREKERDPARD